MWLILSAAGNRPEWCGIWLMIKDIWSAYVNPDVISNFNHRIQIKCMPFCRHIKWFSSCGNSGQKNIKISNNNSISQTIQIAIIVSVWPFMKWYYFHFSYHYFPVYFWKFSIYLVAVAIISCVISFLWLLTLTLKLLVALLIALHCIVFPLKHELFCYSRISLKMFQRNSSLIYRCFKFSI